MASLRSGEGCLDLPSRGVKLWYEVAGKGPTCVFSTPGWGPDLGLYVNTGLRELEKYFTMVWIETRGCGRSSHPTTPSYTIEDHAQDMIALIDKLEITEFVVAGHSAGGLIATKVAAQLPSRCTGVVMLNSFLGFDQDGMAATAAQIGKYAEEGWFPEAHEAFSSMMQLQEPIETEEEVRQKLLKCFRFYFYDYPDCNKILDGVRIDPKALSWSFLNQVMLVDLAEDAKRVTVPVVILSGVQDFICPHVCSQKMHLTFPKSHWVVVDKSGHLPWVEQSQYFWTYLQRALEKSGLCSIKA
eukprot:gb/GECG01007343.1/.p1 GENE.gb/GECG01007343.1/~~gb/GECG01007343.1/.p1  ORF type:complete len:299 (+),score=25.52 gb/GECG01007343.1/:1-897(+)